ncbi:MAG TPA: nucleoside diphosphate kinase regulator [Verrucomicrobiota bacterium]|nr:nucleoside diphosphate kinase regulator [Verrucomicrobiota bacterium]HNU49656.1 nucleoside diphosphate kinase regulator [Verrucomicrobiota bacterium]
MRAVYITSDNHRRLEEFLRATGPNQERDRQALRDLQNELDHAQIVSPEAVPPDVVTMHSHVRVLDLDTGEEMLFRLVFPDEANIEVGRLSVLAPLGTALLGYRSGETISWEVPAGVRRLKILDVLFQPEANGRQT